MTKTTTQTALTVVRSNQIELDKRYMVDIHGHGSKWMKATKVPSVPLSKMTKNDEFVFETAGGKTVVSLRVHGTGGPQFLVAKVPGKRGSLVNARVTFYVKERETVAAPSSKKKAA